MCLFAVLGAFVPRVALVLLWLFTDQVEEAFDSFLIPLIGLVFLPFTTLVYALLWAPGGGVEGLEWVLVGLAALFDLSSYAGSRRARD
jgi:hypothetical protein